VYAGYGVFLTGVVGRKIMAVPEMSHLSMMRDIMGTTRGVIFYRDLLETE
jgi:hypothetical protein